MYNENNTKEFIGKNVELEFNSNKVHGVIKCSSREFLVLDLNEEHEIPIKLNKVKSIKKIHYENN